MKEITTAELRKDSSLLSGSFVLKKMKQGRDKLVDKQFIVIEVPVAKLSERGFDKLTEILSNPQQATEALKDLMNKPRKTTEGNKK